MFTRKEIVVALALTLAATVNNLFDKKYWLWSDVRQADAPRPAGVCPIGSGKPAAMAR